MRVLGMKSKSSPIHRATEEQKEAINLTLAMAEEEGVKVASVQHTPYCGPGSAGDLGAITVDADGRIYRHVYRDGTIGR